MTKIFILISLIKKMSIFSVGQNCNVIFDDLKFLVQFFKNELFSQKVKKWRYSSGQLKILSFFDKTVKMNKKWSFFRSKKSTLFIKPQEQAPNSSILRFLPQCGITFPPICSPDRKQPLQNKCELSPTFLREKFFSFLAVASVVILTRASGVRLTRGRPLKSAPSLQCP